MNEPMTDSSEILANASPEDRSNTRRSEILDAANKVIATAGLKASLQDIADQAGILPGSLYFHFESKDQLLIELAQRYHAELDTIGNASLQRLDERETDPPEKLITDLGCAIARTACAHGAALQLSFYDTGTDPTLVQLKKRSSVIHFAMAQAIRAGRWSGYLRRDTDIEVLADYICQNMLRIGFDYIRHSEISDDVAQRMLQIIMHGLASQPPSGWHLDRSRAFRIAQTSVDQWREAAERESNTKLAQIYAGARSEFGRRGYESTTIKDVASAAGVGQSTVYRLVGSKENLLVSIMRSFGEKVGIGWTDVLQADASPLEKLDALSWLSICAIHYFPDEFRIQLAWLRQLPPDTTTPGWSFSNRIEEMQNLLREGESSGELRLIGPPSDGLAREIIGLQWMPENILWQIGTREALLHVRCAVLRGIAYTAT